MSNTTTNTATKPLRESAVDAAQLLREIKDAVNEMNAEKNPDWGHVGSMTHVVNELRDIRNFLKGEG